MACTTHSRQLRTPDILILGCLVCSIAVWPMIIVQGAVSAPSSQPTISDRCDSDNFHGDNIYHGCFQCPCPHLPSQPPMSFSCFNFRDSDLVLRSCSSDAQNHCGSEAVDFSVHRAVLSAASPFFEAMLSLPQPSRDDDETIPVIPFTETAAVLETLLTYIYPFPDPVIDTLDELVPALEAARKFDLTSATDGLRRRLIDPTFLKTSPLRVYAIASRFELDEEARTAAQATLSTGLHSLPLHDDLKAMSAYAYHRLVLLHERRAGAAIALLRITEDVKCMQCNGRRERLDAPPRWWGEWKERAREELRVRPASGVVFELGFLQQAAQAAGCERCAGSILASSWFFEQLRASMDALPVEL